MNSKITDHQISDIAKRIYSWETIRPFLGLSNSDEVAIKRDYPHGYVYEYQKMQLLSMWKKKKGDEATIGALAQACYNAGEKDLAQSLNPELTHITGCYPKDSAVMVGIGTDSPRPRNTLADEHMSMNEDATKYQQQNLPVMPHQLVHHPINPIPPANATANTDLIKRIFKKKSADMKDYLQDVTMDFSNRLVSSSLIDEFVARRINTTAGSSNLDKASDLVDSVETKLRAAEDPTNNFVDFCKILKRYGNTQQLAIDMLTQAGLYNATPLVPAAAVQVHQPVSGQIQPPPKIQTYDFSEFSNISVYGKPKLTQMLNWIVAEEPSVWNEVGTELNILPGRLNGIKMDLSLGGKPSLMFKEVLVLWERSHSKPYNWQTILDALASPSVDCSRTAIKVSRKLKGLE
jgi:hypothetical protein